MIVSDCILLHNYKIKFHNSHILEVGIYILHLGVVKEEKKITFRMEGEIFRREILNSKG